MNRYRLNYALLALILACCFQGAAVAVDPPMSFDGARAEVYKTVGDVELYLYIFEPDGHDVTGLALRRTDPQSRPIG